jgi:hypothetical protein
MSHAGGLESGEDVVRVAPHPFGLGGLEGFLHRPVQPLPKVGRWIQAKRTTRHGPAARGLPGPMRSSRQMSGTVSV